MWSVLVWEDGKRENQRGGGLGKAILIGGRRQGVRMMRPHHHATGRHDDPFLLMEERYEGMVVRMCCWAMG